MSFTPCSFVHKQLFHPIDGALKGGVLGGYGLVFLLYNKRFQVMHQHCNTQYASLNFFPSESFTRQLCGSRCDDVSREHYTLPEAHWFYDVLASSCPENHDFTTNRCGYGGKILLF